MQPTMGNSAMSMSTDACEATISKSPSVDPNSWPECNLRGLEMLLEAGQLDWLEDMLDGPRTRRVIDLGDPHIDARIHAVRDNLAAARVREALGGPGSLIDPNHKLTLELVKTKKMQAGPDLDRMA
jgi:hypothetical protein